VFVNLVSPRETAFSCFENTKIIVFATMVHKQFKEMIVWSLYRTREI